MESIVLTEIPFDPTPNAVLSALGVGADSPHAAEALALADEARSVAVPKAMHKLAYIDDRGDDHVIVDGIRFSSRVLAVNLTEANRLWARVATCGVELDEWAEAKSDPLTRYWADALKRLALGAAGRAQSSDLERRYRPGKTASMAPGSLADWPLREQRPLFRLLGDVTGSIGVHLTDSYLMVPNKSTSGFRFPKESSFESCQLCPRESCPGRRAKYDPEMYEREYAKPENTA